MGDVFFYHLSERPLEATLPVLLQKATGAGWRVEVRGTDAARLTWLDGMLWQGDGFMPHGIAGGPHDADQPILLTLSDTPDAASQCVMAIDKAPVSAADIAALTRVCILFDGGDAQAVDHARGQWKSLTEGGAKAQYWAEEDGRWIKKAESR